MNLCQACKRPHQLYLCDDCQTQLANMLDQLPWLIEELDNRIAQLDRISLGTIGRNRRPNELNPVDFDAADLARRVRKTLLRWATTVAERHSGRRPPALDTVHTKHLARWLETNLSAITRLNCAGNLYHDIKRLVGTDEQRHGQLVQAINPTEKHLAGPCPTTLGRHHDGTPRKCDTMLFADTYDKTTTCPNCKQTINVQENRERAAADRDLHTKADLLEVLDNIGEPVTETRLNAWIRARRLRPAGWIHDDHAITEFRLNNTAEPVYSVERARKLRRRDHTLTPPKTHA